MPSFRQRPLTWLFVIATLCVDAVAATYQFPDDAVMAMFFGQTFVVGGWLALGKSHRLLRAAVFVVVLPMLAFLLARQFLFEPSRITFDRLWRQILGVSAVLGVTAAVTAVCWSYLLAMVLRRRPEFRWQWQFPLVELFGWMIVVAVGSAIMRVAAFDGFGDFYERIASLLLPTTAALIMVLFLAPHRTSDIPNAIITAIALAALFTVLAQLRAISVELPASIGMFYLGLWILVQRMDAVSELASEPQPAPPPVGQGALEPSENQ